ncbi:hypothetical protein Tco_1563172 [Tanacetum coccineum]
MAVVVTAFDGDGYVADATCRVFITVNKCSHDDAKIEIVANEKDNGDKKNWLISTYLWNTDENLEHLDKRYSEDGTVIAEALTSFVSQKMVKGTSHPRKCIWKKFIDEELDVQYAILILDAHLWRN